MERRLLVVLGLVLGYISCERGGGNIPPVAVIDGDLKTYINEPIRLDGTKSMDPDGDLLEFQWELNSGPGGSSPILADANTATPLFVGDVEGMYEISLVVSDGKEKSKPETGIIYVFADNIKPIADGGEDREIRINEEVELDAGRSADPINKPLTFTWEITKKPEGSSAVLSSTQGVRTRFKPDIPHSTYEITLIADNGLYSSRDTIVINVVNSPPVAVPGGNQSVHPGGSVTLVGSGTDLDGDPIVGYSWSIREQPGNGYFSDPSAKTPVFYTDSSPTAQGDYVIDLRVYDGMDWSEPASIVVSTVNAPPNIIIESDYKQVGHCYGNGAYPNGTYYATNVEQPQCPSSSDQLPVLRVSASAVDPENDPVTPQWSLVSKPGSAPTPNILNPGSFATDVDIRSGSAVITGEYTFRITVTDIYGASSTKDLRINVLNRAPASGGAPNNCSLSVTRNGCTNAGGGYCYTQPMVSFNITTKAVDPDHDPVFNEFYYGGTGWGGGNCVYSHGDWCNSGQECTTSLDLGANLLLCSTTSTWASSTYIRVRFWDGFGALYDDNANDCTLTVYCSTCN